MKKKLFMLLFIGAIISGYYFVCKTEVGWSVGVYGPSAGLSFGSYPNYAYYNAYGPYYDSPGYFAPYWAAPYVYQQPVVMQRVIQREPIIVEQRQRTWSFTNKTDQPIMLVVGDSKITLEPGHKINRIPQTRTEEFSVIGRQSGQQRTFRSNARTLAIKEKNGSLTVERR